VVVMVMMMFMLVFVIVMMMVMVVVTAMVVIIVVIVVVVVMMVVMLVFVLVVIVVVVVMMVVMFVFVLIIVMMMVMVVVTAIVVIVVIVVMSLLFRQLFEFVLKRCGVFHCRQNLVAAKLRPRSGNYRCGSVVLTYKLQSGIQFSFAGYVYMAEDYAGGALYLVIEELAEVLHIHFAFICIYYGSQTIYLAIFKVCPFNRAHDVGQFANARRLDQNSVGVVLLHYLFKRLGKVAYKRTADAA
jgi:hypothetical protein